ncbi:hypothetical protein J132_09973 [Termitomyces sp. J132]|nr:hypothetical protein J132_09973 [Termitomyces sp. J132]
MSTIANHDISLIGMSKHYTLCHRLEGSLEAVNCLVFSPNGQILLSGGDDDTIRVWDLSASQCIQSYCSQNWAQITSIEWLHCDSSPEGFSDWMSVGTGRGSHTLCPKATEGMKFLWNEATTTFPFDVNDPVEAQAYDPVNRRLALASHSGLLKMFKLRSKSLILLWDVKLYSDIPRSLQFFGPGNRYVLSAFLEQGEIISYNGENATIEWRRLLLGGIGNATISPDESILLVDNLTTNSFDLYRFPTGNLVTSIPSKAVERFVKGIVFAEGGKIAICGSDQQFVQIIDLTSQRRCQDLISENPSDIFQTVAAVSLGDHRHLIACGSSSKKPTIYVWEKMDFRHPGRSQNRDHKILDTLIVWFFQSLPIILLATHTIWTPYFWQLIGNVKSTTSAVQVTFDTNIQGPIRDVLSIVELTTIATSTSTASVTTTVTGHAIETVISSLSTFIPDHTE